MTDKINSAFRIPNIEKDNCSFLLRRQYTLLDSSNPFYYHPEYVGHYIADEGYRIDRAGYGTNLILLTRAGAGTLFYQGKEYALTPGSVMLLDCRQPHLYFTAAAPWEFRYLHFAGSDSSAFTAYHIKRFSPVRTISDTVFLTLWESIDEALREIEHAQPSSDAALSALIYDDMMLLLGSGQDSAAVPVPEGKNSVASFEDILRYLDTHLGEPVRTSELAAMLYMTRPYFTMRFKQVYGMTACAYRDARRIARAKQLLIESVMSVGEIAEQVGFQNESAFIRMFVRHTQYTPLQYRKLF